MKRYFYALLAIAAFVLIQGCVTQKTATTIERDNENGCTVHMFVRLGIVGTDSDVIVVRSQLDECYGKQSCYIPCPNNAEGGCNIETHMIVEKWESILPADTGNYHKIKMVDQDDLPSFVNELGTPNGKATGGVWRRHEHPMTYCHEVLHLCGLPDQYCSRVWDSVNRKIIEDVKCSTPPDPNGGNCCNPRARGVVGKRCGTHCEGHDGDLMATLEAKLQCSHLLDAVTRAGLGSCPDECCKKPRTVTQTDGGVSDDPKLHLGGSFYFGFSGLYTHDKISDEKKTYPGANFGASFDVKYNVWDKLDVYGRVRLIDFSQVVEKDKSETTTGMYTYENTYTGNYQMHQTGLDAMVQYEVYPNLNIFGGPSVDFNWLTTTNSYGSTNTTFMGNTTTNTYGDKKYEKIDDNVWKVNVATAGFNLGLNYDLPLTGNWHVLPFAQARFPFTQPLKLRSVPDDFRDYLFTFDVGATFQFGITPP